jgi:hypothetical protein
MKKIVNKSNDNLILTNKLTTDKGEPIVLDYLASNDREIIEKKLKDIDLKIEDLGILCDRKKLRSYEDENNLLKSKKSHYLDELTKLNFKLMEVIKQNTREDFLQKLKKDLAVLKNQVHEKDKELQSKLKFY